MYVSDYSPSKLAAVSSAGGALHGAIAQDGQRFATAEYALFGASPPRVAGDTRGGNFVVAYTEAQPGALLERGDQPGEHVLRVREREVQFAVSAGTVCPPRLDWLVLNALDPLLPEPGTP